MKAIRVEFIRCGEFDKSATYMVPDELSGDQISDALSDAQDQYEDLFNEHEKKFKPNLPSNDLNKQEYDNITVGEAKKRFEEAKQAYEAYWKEDNMLKSTFETVLRGYGIVPQWEYDFGDMEFRVNWGHQHGKQLKYGNPNEKPF